MKARARAALAAACGLLFCAAAVAQQGHPSTPDVPAGPATVVGRLVHETRPDAVANIDLLLYALAPDGSAGLRQGKTDAHGGFRFEGVSNEPDIVYLIGARPGEVPFGSRFKFAPGEREHKIELALSDPTADASRVARGDLELRVERGCTHLRVSHHQELVNHGKGVVFIPAPQRESAAPLFEVELPAEADGFEAIAGGDGLTREGNRVRFWGPLYPGEQMVEFGYGLPLATASFAVGFPSGSSPLAVFAPRDVVQVRSDALRGAPDRAIDGQHYAVLRGAPIAANGSLALAISTTPQPPSPVRTPRAELWLELDDAALEVEERIEVIADGDGAPLSSAAVPLLCVPVPESASELRFSSATFNAGLRRDPSGDLAIHGPLPRGNTQLALSYRLPATRAGAALAKSFDRAVPLLSVLVADNGVVAETTRLHRRKSARVDDRNYLHLEAFAIEPGEAIEIGLRRTEPAVARGHAAPASFALFAGLAALAFLLGPLRSRGAPPLAPAESEGREVERDAIRRSLDALDEDLETGKLSAEDHAAMRAELRARAAELLLAPSPAVRSEPPPQSAPRYCSACGSSVRANDAFCSQCGNKLSA
jgi:hypothetical protein